MFLPQNYARGTLGCQAFFVVGTNASDKTCFSDFAVINDRPLVLKEFCSAVVGEGSPAENSPPD